MIGLVAGCGYSPPGPSWSYRTVTVEGRVTAADVPVGSGWIAFHPVGPTVGDHTIARIREDGTYQAARVPVGPVQVRLQFPAEAFGPDPQRPSSIADRLRLLSGPASPLELTTTAEQPNRFDFDLLTSPLGGQ